MLRFHYYQPLRQEMTFDRHLNATKRVFGIWLSKSESVQERSQDSLIWNVITTHFQIVVHHLERERKLLVQQRHPEDKTTSYNMTGKVTHVRISTWRLI